jgi:predicted small secreted protein
VVLTLGAMVLVVQTGGSTVQGARKDIEKACEAIQDAAE